VTSIRSFLPSELVLAAGLAVIIEGGLFILLVTASNKAHITAKEDPADKVIPIEVKPVLDEMPPLLKLGSKKMRAKLPDMWAKKPPIKRFEAGSAPSPKAEATKEKIPETPVVKKDKEAPPPDAAIAKKVDEQPKTDEPPPKEQNLAEEGHEDGVKEGTETDPLKAFAVGQYRIKISGWFNARFKRPTSNDIPCDELKKLRSSVVATISGERTVSGYTITKPSGNAIFDERVKSTMDAIVGGGAELPPPPPNYSDILGTSISTAFFVPKCD
jgi:outer membrane biosynthesis protein TonB